MLTASDLRIGNLVEMNYAADRHGKKPSASFTTINANSFSVIVDAHFKPIAITEYWVRLAGFKPDQDNILYLDAWQEGGGQRFVLEYVNGKILCRSHYQAYNEGLVMNHIMYVHQLQNLFYFLTGRELQGLY